MRGRVKSVNPFPCAVKAVREPQHEGPALMTEVAEERLVSLLLRLVKKILSVCPRFVFRVLEIALNPKGHLRQLALVVCVQIVSFLLQRLRNTLRHGVLYENSAAIAQDEAQSYDEWLSAERTLEASNPPHLAEDARNVEFFAQLHQRAENYARLQAAGDEYGLMFHLRSELMRKQAGGAGYSRDGSTWLRKHAAARKRIQAYQESVCSALRYVASGVRASGCGG